MVEEEDGNEQATVQFPSSTELQGRAIELAQPAGNVISSCFRLRLGNQSSNPRNNSPQLNVKSSAVPQWF